MPSWPIVNFERRLELPLKFMPVKIAAIQSDLIALWQPRGLNSYGLMPEQRRSDGDGVPC